MNEMFRRIATLLDSHAAGKVLHWGAKPAQIASADRADTSSADNDFRDTDIAVAWLCEASNRSRTRIERQNEAQ
ncbi:MAG: hypothetical protein IV107_14160 [Paucibacter sp.]|nr:hypothetical protein [Roseateles sp.]